MLSMQLPFMNRREELARLRRLLQAREASLCVLYGRRRCGKSRLLQQALAKRKAVYFMADEREAPLQRRALAAEIARFAPGFERAEYPDWDALLARFWSATPANLVLALDEFPALVAAAPELPSLLQRYLDRSPPTRRAPIILAGSSQRMMQGLVLDRTAPLFGRAKEFMKISPLGCRWIRGALRLPSNEQAVEAFSVWGGIPRYWELAADHKKLWRAISSLILSPLGVLHDEPSMLLLDDLRDLAQAASILTLVGQGCHRSSEIAARLGKPATSLARPLERLLGLGILRRDVPFGSSERDSKRSLYRVADPFLRFWYRFVPPNRSRLEARQVQEVARNVASEFPLHVAGVWEDLARESVLRKRYFGHTWARVGSWWGPGADRSPMELDMVAESDSADALLVGEVKWSVNPPTQKAFDALRRKADNLPLARGKRVFLGIWSRKSVSGSPLQAAVFTPTDVVPSLQ
jgi:uncharacterized protein